MRGIEQLYKKLSTPCEIWTKSKGNFELQHPRTNTSLKNNCFVG